MGGGLMAVRRRQPEPEPPMVDRGVVLAAIDGDPERLRELCGRLVGEVLAGQVDETDALVEVAGPLVEVAHRAAAGDRDGARAVAQRLPTG